MSESCTDRKMQNKLPNFSRLLLEEISKVEEEKRYRENVENYLKYLKDKRKSKNKHKEGFLNSLVDSVGPAWYRELSNRQYECLDNLNDAINEDYILGIPSASERLLVALGIFPRLRKSLIMAAIRKRRYDPMLFLWELYIIIFNRDPSVLLKSYSMNARLILSSIAYLGLKNTIKCLNEKSLYTTPQVSPPIKNKCKQKKKTYRGKYLQPPIKIAKVPKMIYNWTIPIEKPQPLPYIQILNDITSKGKNLKKTLKSYKKFQLFVGRKKLEHLHLIYSNDLSSEENTANSVALPNSLNNDSLKTKEHYQPIFNCLKWYSNLIKYYCGVKVVYFQYQNDNLKENKSTPSNKNTTKKKSLLEIGDNKIDDIVPFGMSYANINDYDEDLWNVNLTGPLKSHKQDRNKNINRQCIGDSLIKNIPTKINLNNTLSKKKKRRMINKTKKIKIKPLVLLKVLLFEQAAEGNILALLPEAYKLPILMEWAIRRIYGEVTVQQNEMIIRHQNCIWASLFYHKFVIKPPSLPKTSNQSTQMKMIPLIKQNYYKKLNNNILEMARTSWPTMKIEKFPQKTFKDLFFAYLPDKETSSYMF